MNNIELLKLYQQFGVDEIMAQAPVNRFESEVRKVSDIMTFAVVKQKVVEQRIDQQKNIIVANYGNMTGLEAIAKLAQKQSNNFMQDSKPLISITKIVEQVKATVENINNLVDLEKAVRDFEGCNLKKMATNTVFADGDQRSQIMIIGEAPGNNEDLQGIPFCGDSGRLLNEMFVAIGLPRERLYITNTLFWRPPGNRKPTPDELAMCRPFVEKHIALIAPKLIVLMGATAMSGMLGIHDAISKVRGKFIDYQNSYLSVPIKSIALFHPSYLMRQPNKKKLAWQDLLTIDNFLNSVDYTKSHL